jgi:hypothetical protein
MPVSTAIKLIFVVLCGVIIHAAADVASDGKVNNGQHTFEKLMNLSWGLNTPEPNPDPAVFINSCGKHLEEFRFVLGTNGVYMLKTLQIRTCVALSVSDAEEAVDRAFSHWYHAAYFPGLYVHSADTPLVEYKSDLISSRATILSLVADKYSYKTYLEIGTDDDVIFNVASRHFDVAVGVDPVKGGTHRMTSDVFFAQNRQFFDLVFVDGLHEATQVYKDVINALRWLKVGGTIALHDCSPHGDLEKRTSATYDPSISSEWNGNTWKAVVALRLLGYIDLVVVDVDHGVGVLRRRPNRNPLTAEWIQLLGPDPISALTTDHLRNHRRELLPLVSMNGLQRWLDEEAAGSNEL